MVTLLNHPPIKICGLRTIELTQATIDAGADLIGFVFAPSRRQVTPDQARAIIDAISGPALPVGLFVEDSVDDVNAIARAAGIQVLQLHWRTNLDELERFELPYYLVRRTEPGTTYDEVAADLDRVQRSPNPPLWFMVDAYHPTQRGGTGILADWEFAAKLATSFPLVLAGGLNPGNVGEAIEQVRPLGVDVSSGVERNGEKSPELIREFILSARSSLDRYSSSSEITVQT